MTVPVGPFLLPDLPFDENAFAPVISARTFFVHHGRHHRTYVENLNKLVMDTEFAAQSLETVVKQAHDQNKQAIFNNAAQAWNHSLYWQSLAVAPSRPSQLLADAIERDLGGVDAAFQSLKAAAIGQFGSGWAWLTADDGKLMIEHTGNADTPLVHGRACLLTIDVWEHAYYLDWENRRSDHIDALLNKLNWAGASERFESSYQSKDDRAGR